jgi:HAD superfamily hydrolase (TIGR01509 family)
MVTNLQSQKITEKIEWIVFDAMGVIFEIANNVKYIPLPYLQRFIPKVELSELKELYLKASLGEITAFQLWQHYGLDSQYPSIEKEYISTQFKIDSLFIPTIKELKKRYKIGLISNDLSEWANQLRIFYHLDEFFDRIIISGDVHIRKPDTKIFEIFLSYNENENKLKNPIKATRCVFIDDKFSNLESASALGFHTIHFQRPNNPIEQKGTYTPDAEISSFTQLNETMNKLRDNFI